VRDLSALAAILSRYEKYLRSERGLVPAPDRSPPLPSRLPGAIGEVWIGASSGQNAPDRVRAICPAQPETKNGRYAGDVRLSGIRAYQRERPERDLGRPAQDVIAATILFDSIFFQKYICGLRSLPKVANFSNSCFAQSSLTQAVANHAEQIVACFRIWADLHSLFERRPCLSRVPDVQAYLLPSGPQRRAADPDRLQQVPFLQVGLDLQRRYCHRAIGEGKYPPFEQLG
jgi:hypothetical protein